MTGTGITRRSPPKIAGAGYGLVGGILRELI